MYWGYEGVKEYADPEPPEFNCEWVHDPWQFPDLDDPHAFGDY